MKFASNSTSICARIQQAELSILSAESELALLYLRKETLGGEGVTLINRRETLRADRAIATDEAAKRRVRVRKLEDKLHKRELAASQFEHERTTLVDRLREDYGIELGTQDRQSGEVATPINEYGLPQSPSVKLFVPPTEPPADDRPRVEIEAEIADLRGKLAALGNVNLDALEEADELERRFAGISAQFQDLTQAKASLVQIVTQINADSRRLFAETLETIKEHFQTLFRKLFGGGQVDIVLEEGVDILDGGVEIIARPPGKEPRNISLLSGGERTLTCLALLLAIFRTRPSPFCVLDEVDSALDEANIDRFVTPAPGIPDLHPVHHRHAFEENDDRGQHAVRRDDARIGRLETRLGPVRRRQRKRRHPADGERPRQRRRLRAAQRRRWALPPASRPRCSFRYRPYNWLRTSFGTGSGRGPLAVLSAQRRNYRPQNALGRYNVRRRPILPTPARLL